LFLSVTTESLAAWNTRSASEPSLRTRALLLMLIVSAHGLGASLALRGQTAPDAAPPGVLQVRWIAGEPSGPAPAEPSGEPEAPPAPEPQTPEPPPEPELPPPEPEPPPLVPEPIPEPLLISEAPPEPEAPVAPPPPPPKKPRPLPRPKPPPPRPSPRPAEAPPALAPAAPPGPSAGASSLSSSSSSSSPSLSPSPSTAGPIGPTAPASTQGAAADYVAPGYRAAYLSNPPPVYPPASRRLEEEGKVTLRVHITVEGLADEVLLHRGSGFERLDRAALEAVRRWRFTPARRGREKLPGWVLVPIQFRLES
jgi:protein TonB